MNFAEVLYCCGEDVLVMTEFECQTQCQPNIELFRAFLIGRIFEPESLVISFDYSCVEAIPAIFDAATHGKGNLTANRFIETGINLLLGQFFDKCHFIPYRIRNDDFAGRCLCKVSVYCRADLNKRTAMSRDLLFG